MTVDTFCVIPLSVCNATQCIILYKVIICATCVTIHTFCYTNVCGLYNVYIICTHPALRSIYTQCVISHTLCNLCVLFYFYTNQVCFYTQCVVLHTFLLLGPINLDLRYFVAKSVFVIYAFFGVNFILMNDKYQVWVLVSWEKSLMQLLISVLCKNLKRRKIREDIGTRKKEINCTCVASLQCDS